MRPLSHEQLGTREEGEVRGRWKLDEGPAGLGLSALQDRIRSVCLQPYVSTPASLLTSAAFHCHSVYYWLFTAFFWGGGGMSLVLAFGCKTKRSKLHICIYRICGTKIDSMLNKSANDGDALQPVIGGSCTGDAGRIFQDIPAGKSCSSRGNT